MPDGLRHPFTSIWGFDTHRTYGHLVSSDTEVHQRHGTPQRRPRSSSPRGRTASSSAHVRSSDSKSPRLASRPTNGSTEGRGGAPRAPPPSSPDSQAPAFMRCSLSSIGSVVAVAHGRTTPSLVHTASAVLSAISRNVVSLPPTMLTMPPTPSRAAWSRTSKVRVHRLQDSPSSLLPESHDGRPGTAGAAESRSSRSKPQRQLGHAGIHPSVAFARALLAPGILVP